MHNHGLSLLYLFTSRFYHLLRDPLPRGSLSMSVIITYYITSILYGHLISSHISSSGHPTMSSGGEDYETHFGPRRRSEIASSRNSTPIPHREAHGGNRSSRGRKRAQKDRDTTTSEACHRYRPPAARTCTAEITGPQKGIRKRGSKPYSKFLHHPRPPRCKYY